MWLCVDGEAGDLRVLSRVHSAGCESPKLRLDF